MAKHKVIFTILILLSIVAFGISYYSIGSENLSPSICYGEKEFGNYEDGAKIAGSGSGSTQASASSNAIANCNKNVEDTKKKLAEFSGEAIASCPTDKCNFKTLWLINTLGSCNLVSCKDNSCRKTDGGQITGSICDYKYDLQDPSRIISNNCRPCKEGDELLGGTDKEWSCAAEDGQAYAWYVCNPKPRTRNPF